MDVAHADRRFQVLKLALLRKHCTTWFVLGRTGKVIPFYTQTDLIWPVSGRKNDRLIHGKYSPAVRTIPFNLESCWDMVPPDIPIRPGDISGSVEECMDNFGMSLSPHTPLLLFWYPMSDMDIILRKGGRSIYTFILSIRVPIYLIFKVDPWRKIDTHVNW